MESSGVVGAYAVEAEGKKYAIIVGVSKYEKAGLGDLRYSCRDARRLALVLQDHCGFVAENVRLFSDDEDSDLPGEAMAPAFSDILEETKRAADTATEDDLILFFFAGHGNEISEKAYLLTNDTRLNVIDRTAIPLDAVNEYLEQSRAKCKVRIFDACRATFGERRLTLGLMSRGYAEALLKTPHGSVTLCACSSGETAIEHADVQQGVFSFYLCEGLSGAAMNDEGVVTLERLIEYVNISVANWSQSHGHKQTPQYRCDIAGTLALSRVHRRVKDQVASPELESPLAALKRFLNDHITSLPPEVRRARHTSPEDIVDLQERVFALVKRRFGELAHPHISVADAGPVRLHAISSELHGLFHHALHASQLVDDCRHSNPEAIRVDLVSDTSVIASSYLVLAVVPFKFCYWLWWAHSLHESSIALTRDVPAQHADVVSDYVTLLGADATNEDKIQQGVEAALRQVQQAIQAWSEACARGLDAKLRQIGDSSQTIL